MEPATPTNPAALRDRRIFFATAFVRAAATAMSGVLLGLFLAELALPPAQIGLVVAVGLAGSAAGTLAATLLGDRLGRRRLLLLLTGFAVVGGVAFALSASPGALALTAFAGMVNGMGRDRSGWLVLETAVLPDTAADAERTAVFARYNVVQDAGHALGSLLGGLPTLLQAAAGLGSVGAYRASFVAYAALMAVTAVLHLGLSAAVEPRRDVRSAAVSAESRVLVAKISALFALDSLGGGFMTTSLLALFFKEQFHVGDAVLGGLFFAARVANALSHLAAARLARRIGLVNTMVFTHIPSSLLLCTVPFAPSFAVGAALFVLREGLVEMDVPTRQSYLMAVTRPHERLFAGGVTNLVRVASWAVAPSFAGLFMQYLSRAAPLWVGAGIKIAYDVLLWAALRRVKPPEER